MYYRPGCRINAEVEPVGENDDVVYSAAYEIEPTSSKMGRSKRSVRECLYALNSPSLARPALNSGAKSRRQRDASALSLSLPVLLSFALCTPSRVLISATRPAQPVRFILAPAHRSRRVTPALIFLFLILARIVYFQAKRILMGKHMRIVVKWGKERHVSRLLLPPPPSIAIPH